MSRGTVGGTLDLAALVAAMKRKSPVEIEAARLAHRPQDRREFAREAARLAKQGLTPRDIAGVLQLTPGGVRELLHEAAHEAAPSRPRR